MTTIAQRFNDGTVTLRYDNGTISAPIMPVGTAGASHVQHKAHVLLKQLNQANAAKRAHKEHLAHVAHVQHVAHVEHVKERTAKDLRLYNQPSFFGLYRRDYALGKTLSELRAAGASPKRIGEVYRAGLQARRNQAEVNAQYLEKVAAGGFNSAGIYQTQEPTQNLLGGGGGSTLSDILGSFTGGSLPDSYGQSLFTPAGQTEAEPAPSPQSSTSMLALLAVGAIVLVMMRKGRHVRRRL